MRSAQPAPTDLDGIPWPIIEPLCSVFRRKLRSEGLKYTPERARVLDAIVRRDALFDADELIAELRSSGVRVSKATIYRTIKLMLEAGIIQRVPLDEDPARYILSVGPSGQASDLLIQLDTGRVEVIRSEELERMCERLCQERGLKIQGHRLQIFAVQPGQPGRPASTN